MPIYICAILLMIAADQAVKYWAFTSLQAQQTIPLINGVFHLTYIENRGAAFSLVRSNLIHAGFLLYWPL